MKSSSNSSTYKRHKKIHRSYSEKKKKIIKHSYSHHKKPHKHQDKKVKRYKK